MCRAGGTSWRGLRINTLVVQKEQEKARFGSCSFMFAEKKRKL